MWFRSETSPRSCKSTLNRLLCHRTAPFLTTLPLSHTTNIQTARAEYHQLQLQGQQLSHDSFPVLNTTKMSTITTTALQTSYPPILPKSFNGNQPKTIRLYPLSNYTFGTKETQPEEDPSVLARLKRLEEHYDVHGMRRTCEGILVCHEHNHPHILMLQIANAFFKLPGDYLKEDDDEIEGFKMRLNERLAPVGSQFSGEGVNEEWEIGDTLAQWWRPNFETFMYPFIPAHVTRPKECKKLYFIQLPRQSKDYPVKYSYEDD